MFQQILLAVDGSDHALHAARVAGDLARSMHTPMLRIVVAFAPIPSYLGAPMMQTAIDNRLAEAKEILDAAMRVVGKTDGAVHSELIEGSPAEAIVRVAETRKSDLIVMGSRGLSTLAGLVMGSTSQKVVAHAHCPVLVVR